MIENIFSPKLTKILPPNLLQDPKIAATAESLNLQLEKISAASLEVLHLPRLDILPSEILDHLAFQWHVDNYNVNFDNKTKCDMIRESIYLHRIKGTPHAVELAIAPFTDGANVIEWFDYDGKPYFFKLSLQNIKDLGDDGEKLIRIIFASKNVRSWLEEIFIDLTREILDTEKIHHGVTEEIGGTVNFDILNNEFFDKDKTKIFTAISEKIGGIIHISPENTFHVKSKSFHSTIQKSAGTIFVDVDFSFDPSQLAPPLPDFLQIVFNYQNGSRRIITLPNPRKNITPAELAELDNYKFVLLSRSIDR